MPRLHPILSLPLLSALPILLPAQDPALFARFHEKVRLDLSRVPNYTCLETISRSDRRPGARDFTSADTLRFEVSNVNGRELYAYPGSRRFDDRALTSLVSSGTIATGAFALYAHNLFLGHTAVFTPAGEEALNGHTALRYDFQESGSDNLMQLRIAQASASVPSKGSFWFDPASLDLLRLDAYADSMPLKLHLEEMKMSTEYARTPIGDTAALLPRRSELTMTHFSGEANRNVIDFSRCHEYRTESSISFDAIPDSPTAPPQPATREVDLPAGLLVSVALESGIDSSTASSGDAVRARVIEPVLDTGGQAVLPKSALLSGHITRLDLRSSKTQAEIGISFEDADWQGAHAVFTAELVEIPSQSSAARHLLTYFDGRRKRIVVDNNQPGFGSFFAKSPHFRLPPGLVMVWRTLAPQ